MSLSNIFVNDTKAQFKDVSCNTLNCDTFNTENLSADSITAQNNITSVNGTISATNGDIYALNGLAQVDRLVSQTFIQAGTNVSGQLGNFQQVAVQDYLTFPTKANTPLTNSSPAPTIAITGLCGTVQLNLNVAFPSGSTIDVTVTNANIFASSLAFLNMGPDPNPSNASLDVAVASVSAGQMVFRIANNTGGAAGSPVIFSYLIV